MAELPAASRPSLCGFDVDVIIVGAGLSGIGAACHLAAESPERTFVLLEGRDDLGGTWDLFRYPGVRSDSDMHTLGFAFKPWTASKSIADGPSILAYLRETVAEHDLAAAVRYRHTVTAASWNADRSCWTVTAETPGGEVTLTAAFVFMCAGYYSYAAGHTPTFPGRELFGGTILHPQAWPEDVDYADKRVVVIGSGATAITIVPAMAATASHVTMLQRSPTWVASRPDHDPIANALRAVLPSKLAYRITRFKNTLFQQILYKQSRTKPDKMRQALLDRVAKELGPELEDQIENFTPSYNPWDQRLCLVTNGDLFSAMKDGSVEVVTDQIERFDATYFCGHEHEFNMVQPHGAAWQVLVGSGGSPWDAQPGEVTKNPASDRSYAWATVAIHQSGKVDIDAYGFDEKFGPTKRYKHVVLAH